MATTDTDTATIAGELVTELNLDASELPTVTSIVQASAEIIARSSDSAPSDKLTIPAIKTLAQAIYYDRSLANGMPNGLIMMLAHLQAAPATTTTGDSNAE
ncbi:hypothetical protein [Schleiferilactobacillus harbinensis]|uniref:hypothetical protein n=1 Tax=Schleiferilactobacillus harbinensis TaxID=304207 RepID=UPI0039E87737